jgi:SNF family Na+-dependent transporter
VIAAGRRRGLLIAGAIVLPFALISAYLLIAEYAHGRYGEAAGYLALGLAAASGAACVWHLFSRIGARIAATLVFFATCCGWLILYSLYFVCGVFGDCL